MVSQFDAQCQLFYDALESMPISFLNELAENLPVYIQQRKLKAADALIEGKQKMLKRAHLKVVK